MRIAEFDHSAIRVPILRDSRAWLAMCILSAQPGLRTQLHCDRRLCGGLTNFGRQLFTIRQLREADWDRSCWRGKARRVAVEPSAISTASLKPLPGVHVPPINQLVLLGPYPVDLVGTLIFRRASRLDAFSGYPDRTSATQRCPWQDNWYTGGPSVPVLSY